MRKVIQELDMLNAFCFECVESKEPDFIGRYQETTQFDDMDGVLHCTICNHEIDRRLVVVPKREWEKLT